MKKTLISVLLTAVLAAGLFGCSAQRKDEPEADLPVLSIGVDNEYEPYSYMSDTGELVGSDIELAREACRRIGYQPVYKPIQWDRKNDYLADGTIDCVWSCFTYTGREKEYLWAGPYLYSRQVIVVKSDSDITECMQLTGKRVAVMSSTKPEELLLENADGTSVPKVGEILSFANLDLAFTAMRRGYADAVVGHESAMRQLIDSMSEDYRMLESSLQQVEVGVAFRKDGDAALVSKLNDALQEMAQDGTTETIIERYGLDAENVIKGEQNG